MKKSNVFKISLSCLLVLSPISATFAVTTEKWRDIVDQLRDDWRPNWEIKPAIEDLWYNSAEYLWKNINSNIKVISGNGSNSTNLAGKTSKLWREILNQYRKDWRTDNEIKEALEDLWLDTSGYFPEKATTSITSSNTTSNSTDWPRYISRSCKPYTIQYLQSLNVYTSPDLNKREYFINTDYLKRYVDSKNAQSTECYIDWWWISVPYTDSYTWTDSYIAPNWKVYFIKEQNWLYTSDELASPKSFSNIDELKNYIWKRNPLIWMWALSSKYSNIQQNTSQTQNSTGNSVWTWEQKNDDSYKDALTSIRNSLMN